MQRNTHKMINADSVDYSEQIMQLIILGQDLCGQTHGIATRLCREVAHITQGKAHLHLHSVYRSDKAEPLLSNPSIHFPVQFRRKEYGVLHVVADTVHSMSPVLPLNIGYLIACTCGWILYTIEQSVLVQGRSNQLTQPIHVHLTGREKEVLLMIGCGYCNEKIAETLNIATTTVIKHRQNIYEQLGVHSERDALLVAYQSGIFSPLEESQISTTSD